MGADPALLLTALSAATEFGGFGNLYPSLRVPVPPSPPGPKPTRGSGPGHEANLLLLQLTGGGRCQNVWEDGHGVRVQALW